MLIDSILKLKEAGHDIVLIGTCEASPEYGVGPDDFRRLAEQLGAGFFCNTRINSPEIIETLKNARAEIAVSVNWLTVIGTEAVKAFPSGILNAHAGDLPRYRGNACPNWAILQGEDKVWLTIHLMEPGELDAGAIILQRHFPLRRETRIGEVYAFMEQAIPEMFIESATGVASGIITPKPQPQDPSLALRCYPRIPSDSYLDWQTDAEYLARIVRASSEPFQGAYTYWEGKRLTIWRAHAESFSYPSLAVPGQVLWRDPEKGQIGVATGNGALILHEVEQEGVARTKAADLLRSTQIRLGLMVEDEVAVLRRRVEMLEKLVSVKRKIEGEEMPK